MAPRAPLLVAALLSLCAPIAMALRRALKPKAAALHPGHKAVFTSRLLRNEHQGLAALLESEARWRNPSSSSLLEETSALPFVRLSARQASWLQEHQEQELARGSDELAGGLVQEGEEEDGEDPTAVKLSSLQSEYVGPIGVGSVYSDESCAALSETQRATSEACTSTAQSAIWVVFDTGSTNLWVNSDACTGGSCAKPGRLQYNHSDSTTYRAPDPEHNLTVHFGTGSISGPMALDDFHVGSLTLSGQSFGMIQEQEGAVFETLPIEGILGLAFQGMAAEGTTSFLENVVQQQMMPKSEVAFYFSLRNPSANAMLWGGVDSRFHQEPIEYFNVSKPFYWGIKLLAFEVKGHNLLATTRNATSSSRASEAASAEAAEEGWEAIIDTGTTYWTAPNHLFGGIMAQLPRVPCDQMTDKSHPPITFRFEKADGELRDFTFQNSQYMVTSFSEKQWCNPAVMKLNMRSGHEKGMIFGEVFLRHYFSVFDRADGDPANARVGFGLASQGDEVDDHLRTITQDQPLFSDRHAESVEEE